MVANLNHLVFFVRRRIATHLIIALVLFDSILVVYCSYHGKFAITSRSLGSQEIIRLVGCITLRRFLLDRDLMLET